MKTKVYTTAKDEDIREEIEIVDIISEEIKDNEDSLKLIDRTNQIITRLKERLEECNLFPLSDEEVIVVNKAVLIVFAKVPEEYSKKLNFQQSGKDIIFDRNAILNILFDSEIYEEVTMKLITKEDYAELKNTVMSIFDPVSMLYKFYVLSEDDRYKFYIRSVYSSIIDSTQLYETAQKERVKARISNLKKLRKIFLSENIVSNEALEKLLDYNGGSNIDLKKTLNPDVIRKYNEEVYKRKKALVYTSINQDKSPKEKVIIPQLTREERIREYAMKKVTYEDAGEIILTEDEQICLQMYLEIISNITDIDLFANQAASLLEKVPGTNYENILFKLNEKIQNSNDFDAAFKKKISKILSHLSK